MPHEKQYVQYGCGFCAPIGWKNFDASPTLRFERIPILGALYTKNIARFPENVQYGDIIKGIPISSNSCDIVYCSHVLEHLSLSDFRIALQNTHHILRQGGIFRFVLPDLEYYIHAYIKNTSDNAALQFMKGTSLGVETRKRGLSGLFIAWLGNSEHLWMWDYKSLRQELLHAGFCDIRRAVFGDSSNDAFQAVESKERWRNALGIECKKSSPNTPGF